MEKILIEKVREHEVLYNQVAPNYRDPNIRQEAWDAIGKELQITGNEAKELWDKLRRCFCNARKRRRDEDGIASKKISPWKYQQQMSFILPFVGNRKKQNNSNKSQAYVYLAEPEDLSEESEGNENIPHKSEPEDHIHSVSESERCDQDDGASDIFDVAETVNNRYETVKLLNITKQQEIFGTAAQHNDEKCSQSQSSKIPSLLETMDETDMFFLSMSRMTKKLPKPEQSQIKLALSNSVLSAELRYNNAEFT